MIIIVIGCYMLNNLYSKLGLILVDMHHLHKLPSLYIPEDHESMQIYYSSNIEFQYIR